jgi:tetratricopeptide (TPR) repeat protein
MREERWQEALDASSEAAGLRMQLLGPEHPYTASSQLAQALALNKLGDLRQAESLLRGVIGLYTKQLGREHWQTANALTYLGIVLTNRGRYAEASAALEESERTLRQQLGADHWRTANVLKARRELAAARKAGAPARQ